MKHTLFVMLIVLLTALNAFAVLRVTAGSADVFVPMKVRNELTALPQTVAYDDTGITMSYYREDADADVDDSSGGGVVTATLGTHTDWSVILVDDDKQKGMVQLCFPDLAFASGAEWVTLYLHADDYDESLLVQLENSVDTVATTALLNAAREDINDIEADTATIDTQTKLRTLLTGSDTAVSTLTVALLNALREDVNDIEADTTTLDTQTKLRTLLTGSDTALSTITTALFNALREDVNDIELDTGTTLNQLLDSEVADIWSYIQAIDANTATGGGAPSID